MWNNKTNIPLLVFTRTVGSALTVTVYVFYSTYTFFVNASNIYNCNTWNLAFNPEATVRRDIDVEGTDEISRMLESTFKQNRWN